LLVKVYACQKGTPADKHLKHETWNHFQYRC